MKLNGQPVSVREVREVTLTRSDGKSITLKICGYPIGINRDYATIFPKPKPPYTEVNKAGRLDKDKVYNLDDPKWEKDIADWNYLLTFYIIWRGLSCDANISFESNVVDRAGLESLVKEFFDAGFSEGDIGYLLGQINDASTVTPKEVDKALDSFSSNLTK